MSYKEFLNYWKLKKMNFLVLLVLCLVTCSTYGQKDQIISLNIGDTAPPLCIKDWIKGTPIAGFEKGKVYVVEFWATWCVPCKAAIPHLSSLADKYRNKVTFLGINILEKKTTSVQQIKSFVDSMGHQMDYYVATEESNLMEAGWLNASGAKRQGIPNTFVINTEGKVAWIGHPKDIAEVLPKIVNDTWDIKEALSKRNSDRYLRELADSLNIELVIYAENHFKKDYRGKPELALQAIDEIVRKEPRLKYTPSIASFTFRSLLKTNQHKAYEYATVFLVTSTYEEPDYSMIYDIINEYSTSLRLSAEIYKLGAEAHQIDIDKLPYPQLVNLPKRYSKMAELYWCANDKLKAIEAQQKALEELKSKKGISKAEMETFRTQLQKYKNM